MFIEIICYCHLKGMGLGFAILTTFLKLGLYGPNIVSICCRIICLFFGQNVADVVMLPDVLEKGIVKLMRL